MDHHRDPLELRSEGLVGWNIILHTEDAEFEFGFGRRPKFLPDGI